MSMVTPGSDLQKAIKDQPPGTLEVGDLRFIRSRELDKI